MFLGRSPDTATAEEVLPAAQRPQFQQNSRNIRRPSRRHDWGIAEEQRSAISRMYMKAQRKQRSMALNEDRQILYLTDSELEDLIKKWLANLTDTYVGFDPTDRMLGEALFACQGGEYEIHSAQ